MTAELVLFADAEDTARLHLTSQLDGITVYAGTTPETLTRDSVAVVRVGGHRAGMVLDTARLHLDCRAETDGAAVALAEHAAAILHAAALEGVLDTVACYRVQTITPPYGNPDPRHPNLRRATVAVDVTLRGHTTT